MSRVLGIFSTLLLFFSLFVGNTLADFNLFNWRYFRDIRLTDQISQDSLAAFNLDNQVFENSKSDLSDLRIVDAAGVEVAYKLAIESEKQLYQTYAARMINVGSLPQQYTEVVLDLANNGSLHNSVTLITPSTNFRKRVEVEASSDGNQWFLIKKANEGPLIYDYSLDFKAHATTVNYPSSTYRFLRLKIIDDLSNPIKVTGATTFNNLLIGAREVRLKPAVLVTKQEKQDTQITLDLGARGIPNNQIVMGTDVANFNRQVVLEGSNDNSKWVPLGGDVIFNYRTEKFTDSKLFVTYPESNLRYIKVTVKNHDDQPISFAGFEVVGNLRRVLFLVKAGQTYRLYYGNSRARLPEYDLQSYLQYLNTENPLGALLSFMEKNPSFVEEKAAEKPITERYPYLLSSVLGIAVLVLGTMVFKLLRQVKTKRRR